MRTFQFGNRILNEHSPVQLCGILNVTPDSFSDGGQFNTLEKAIEQTKRLIEQGADMIDIGGESTRPGSVDVSDEEEIERVVPVIQAIREFSDIPISIDTWKATVAEASLEAGATIVNDITGLLGDQKMAFVVAKHRASVIAMFNPTLARPHHESSKIFRAFRKGEIFSNAEMEAFEKEENIVDVMFRYFEHTFKKCEQAGIPKEKIMLDIGIGFGLTKKENYELIALIDKIHEKGYTTFLGVSRKRFIMSTLEENEFNSDVSTEEGYLLRDIASAHLTTIATLKGVSVVRVHDILQHKLARSIAQSVKHYEFIDDTHLKQYNKSRSTWTNS